MFKKEKTNKQKDKNGSENSESQKGKLPSLWLVFQFKQVKSKLNFTQQIIIY